MASASLLLLVAFVIGVVSYFRYIRRYEELRPSRRHRSRKASKKSKGISTATTSPGETIAPPPTSFSTFPTMTSATSSTVMTTSEAPSTLRPSETTSTSIFTTTLPRSRFLSSRTARSTVTSREMCDCGSDARGSHNDGDVKVRNLDLGRLLRPTICIPIEYAQYKPEPKGLISLIDSTAPTELCEAALKPHPRAKDLGHLAPYKPILHAIHYSHTHSKMLNELCENYAYIENN